MGEDAPFSEFSRRQQEISFSPKERHFTMLEK
jgi:hypothetical protein